MRIRWNSEWLPCYSCYVGPDGSGSGAPSSSGDGGGSTPSAPSSSPAASPSGSTPNVASPDGSSTSDSSHPPSGGATPADAVLDFESIFNGPPDPTPAAPPAQPTTPPAAPPPAQTPPAQPPAQPTTPPAQTPPATPPGTPPAAAQPALDASDPASLAAHLMQNEAAAVAHLAENLFKLSPEDIEALESDTVGTIPKLLARSFVKTQATILGQIARLVPSMIQKQTVASTKNAEAENEFYTAWPQIDRAKHGELVRRYAVTYRQMHPQATRQQMFADLGPIVMMAARIPPGTPVPPQPQKPQPFVPAGAGGASSGNGAMDLSPIEAMFLGQDN